MRLGLTGLAKDPARPSAATRLRGRLAALPFAPGVEAALATEVRFPWTRWRGHAGVDTLALLAVHGRALEAAIRLLADRLCELKALTGASHVVLAGLVGHAGT